jgi:hypothetical protein
MSSVNRGAEATTRAWIAASAPRSSTVLQANALAPGLLVPPAKTWREVRSTRVRCF